MYKADNRNYLLFIQGNEEGAMVLRNTCTAVLGPIAVCIYRLVMMSIDLSKTFASHVQTITGSADVIVPQLLRYHMSLLY